MTITWGDIVLIASMTTVFVCACLLIDILPKHLRWRRENRNKNS